MQYKDKETGQVYESMWEYRKATQVSCPNEPSDELLEALNLEKIQEETEAVSAPDLELIKANALDNLNALFNQYRTNQAVVNSSLGFQADATERALIDVGGLVSISTGLSVPITFMDADNQPRELTHDEFVVLHREIALNGSKAYQRKWKYRDAINNAQDVQAVRSIVQSINFEEI